MRTFFCFFWIFLLLHTSILNSFGQEEEIKRIEPGIIVEKGGLLIGKESIDVDFALQYSYNTSRRVDLTGITLPGIVIGLIQIEKIRRHILVPSLSVRYGVTDSFQVSLKVPYVFRFDEYTYSPATQDSPEVTKRVDEGDIGDIEGAISFNLLEEKGSRPQIFAGARVKTRSGKDPYGLPTEEATPGKIVYTELPTGTGHWAVEPYVTLIRTVDPAVLFGTLSYYCHNPRHVKTSGGTQEVDPSDSFNFSFGLAYALNEKLALSTAYDQKIYNRMRIDGVTYDDTNPVLANLRFGISYVCSKRASVNLGLAIGLTEDSPDVQITINIPFRFWL
jgi:hypothetical protein